MPGPRSLRVFSFSNVSLWHINMTFICLLVCEIRIRTMAQAGLELNLAASASQILGLHIPITLYTYGSVQTLTRVVI